MMSLALFAVAGLALGLAHFEVLRRAIAAHVRRE